MKWFCLVPLIILGSQLGCQAPTVPSQSTTEEAKALTFSREALNGNQIPFERQKTYLAMALPFAPTARLREQLEKKLGRELIHRGEAHITVVTPPEAEKIAPYVTIEEVQQIAETSQIQNAQVSAVCLGRGVARADQTYFIVVQSDDLRAIRRAIQKRVLDRGGNLRLFQADHFFPHVTVGFTSRDLHEGDGVIKNARSCLYQLAQ